MNKLKITILNSKKKFLQSDFGYVILTILSNERCWCGFNTFFFRWKYLVGMTHQGIQKVNALFEFLIIFHDENGAHHGALHFTHQLRSSFIAAIPIQLLFLHCSHLRETNGMSQQFKTYKVFSDVCNDKTFTTCTATKTSIEPLYVTKETFYVTQEIQFTLIQIVVESNLPSYTK